MNPLRRNLILLFLMSGAFALGTMLQPRAAVWAGRSQSGSLMQVLLGDSRRMFAYHFYVKADISFHSGYYPSIFDQARKAEEQENAIANRGDHESHEGHEGHEGHEAEHSEEVGFLGEPTDWIDRFGRQFKVTEHTHLEGDKIKEILPWLRISAELDPHRIETYTTAAYWLRSRLDKVPEAEQFLREGLRANPDSYEILFEMGELQHANRHDSTRARNLWTLAIRRWNEREAGTKEPDFKGLHNIALALGNLERESGNDAAAIGWLEIAKAHSAAPDALQKQINELRAKMSASPTSPNHQ